MTGPLRAPSSFAQRVIDWQRRRCATTCPGRGDARSDTGVWLSEIVLQQTAGRDRAAVLRALRRATPTMHALAAAPLDDVTGAVERLGTGTAAPQSAPLRTDAVVRTNGSAVAFPRSQRSAHAASIGRSTGGGDRGVLLRAGRRHPSTTTSGAMLTRVLTSVATWPERRTSRALWDGGDGAAAERGIERYTQNLMDLGATLCSARARAYTLMPVRRLRGTATRSAERYPVNASSKRKGTRERCGCGCAGRIAALADYSGPRAACGAEPVEPAVRQHRGRWARPRGAQPGRNELRTASRNADAHLDWTLYPRRVVLPARTAATTSIEAIIVAAWPSGRWFHARRLRRLPAAAQCCSRRL